MSHRRSVSQLNAFSGCGERYRLERMVKNLPYRPAAWTIIGSAFHEAREAWELDLRRNASLAERFLVFYDDLILKAWEKQPDARWWMKRPNVKTVERDIELYREHGEKQAEAYEASCRNSAWKIWTTPDGEPGLELGFSILFGQTEVIGYIDLIKDWGDGFLTIEDTKTGNKGNVNNRQLGLYALAVNESFGTSITQAEYWYTKTGESGGYTDVGPGSRYTREYLSDQYTLLDFGIENRIFLANPGSHCDLCSVRPQCREMGAIQIGTVSGVEALPGNA